MPGGDRTGPIGRGQMTGRVAGYCAGFPAGGYANPESGRGLGRGLGRGMGRGRGLRMRSYAQNTPISAKEEAQILKTQASSMQEQINLINVRIQKLESLENNL